MEQPKHWLPFVSENALELYQLHQMSQTYNVRPSLMLDIKNSLAAYQFDKAVSAIGNKVDTALQENARKKKPQPQQVIIYRLLGKKDDPRGYASLKDRVTKTVKIKDGQDPLEVL